MPNHVTTRCIVIGAAAEVQRFRETMIVTAVDEDNGQSYTRLDFNVAIPRPAALDGVDASSHSEQGATLIRLRAERGAPFATGGLYDSEIKYIRDDVGMQRDGIQEVAAEYLKKHPDIEEQGRRRLRAILETGFADWYSWSLANWGTKWNSYQFAIVSEDPLEIKFDTAWSFPEPVFEKIASMFPGLAFECCCYDEGSNFASEGFFNPPAGAHRFKTCDATDALYERVYGHPPEREDEDDEDAA